MTVRGGRVVVFLQRMLRFRISCLGNSTTSEKERLSRKVMSHDATFPATCLATIIAGNVASCGMALTLLCFRNLPVGIREATPGPIGIL